MSFQVNIQPWTDIIMKLFLFQSCFYTFAAQAKVEWNEYRSPCSLSTKKLWSINEWLSVFSGMLKHYLGHLFLQSVLLINSLTVILPNRFRISTGVDIPWQCYWIDTSDPVPSGASQIILDDNSHPAWIHFTATVVVLYEELPALALADKT